MAQKTPQNKTTKTKQVKKSDAEEKDDKPNPPKIQIILTKELKEEWLKEAAEMNFKLGTYVRYAVSQFIKLQHKNEQKYSKKDLEEQKLRDLIAPLQKQIENLALQSATTQKVDDFNFRRSSILQILEDHPKGMELQKLALYMTIESPELLKLIDKLPNMVSWKNGKVVLL
jgi:hypothetical protein